MPGIISQYYQYIYCSFSLFGKYFYLNYVTMVYFYGSCAYYIHVLLTNEQTIIFEDYTLA